MFLCKFQKILSGLQEMEESSTPEILPTGEGVLIIDEVKVYVHAHVH